MAANILQKQPLISGFSQKTPININRLDGVVIKILSFAFLLSDSVFAQTQKLTYYPDKDFLMAVEPKLLA
jgi:hypothetical protein